VARVAGDPQKPEEKYFDSLRYSAARSGTLCIKAKGIRHRQDAARFRLDRCRSRSPSPWEARIVCETDIEETIMKHANDNNREQRKGSRFGFLFEEWFFNVLLVVAVVTVLVEGASTLGNVTLI
jgi:hypothetical protein